MPETALQCPKCLKPIEPSAEAETGAAEMTCRHCHASLTLEVFPRLTSAEPASGQKQKELRAQEGEAVCQFYPELQAETVCDECGCFLSRKAAVQWSGRDLCMPCLHHLRENKAENEFSARRRLVDNVGLALILFLLPLTLFTGPFAIFYLIRHRNAPGSLVPRGKFRWWLALSFAIASTLGWLFLIVVWIATIIRAVTGV